MYGVFYGSGFVPLNLQNVQAGSILTPWSNLYLDRCLLSACLCSNSISSWNFCLGLHLIVEIFLYKLLKKVGDCICPSIMFMLCSDGFVSAPLFIFALRNW